jgi:hypothetical protein
VSLLQRAFDAFFIHQIMNMLQLSNHYPVHWDTIAQLEFQREQNSKKAISQLHRRVMTATFVLAGQSRLKGQAHAPPGTTALLKIWL